MHANEIISAVKLSRMPGVGANMFKTLIDKYKLPSIALNTYKKILLNKKQLSHFSAKKHTCRQMLEYTLKKIIDGDCNTYIYGQNEYPTQLYDLSEPPPILLSSSKINNKKFIAIVGTRKASQKAKNIVNKIVKNINKDIYAILSGGAAGIDTLAHQAAINNNIFTAAILGSGIDICYPQSNEELFKTIKIKGAILSELLYTAPPRKSFFPTRNRLIAAMADEIIVVQAGRKSGSLITANWAKKLKRRIFVCKPPDNTIEWAGNLQLLDSGAEQLPTN